MTNKIRVIGDLHLSHLNILPSRLDPRWCSDLGMIPPYAESYENLDSYNSSIMDDVLSSVNKGDTLVLTGDIVFGPIAIFDLHLQAAVRRKWTNWSPNDALPFILKVVIGNHDKVDKLLKSKYITPNRLMAHLECKVLLPESIQHFKVVITHIPVHPEELKVNGGRWDVNIHAHLHDKQLHATGYACSSYDQDHYALSVELLARRSLLGSVKDINLH